MPPKTRQYKESLIPRIQDLIDGYSSASILKEYLQNADDSGATELIVTFDKQNYSFLENTDYQSIKGSALLFYNNSIFEDKDFDSIVEISAKGKVEDAKSTGRFGQGFSSSFSISDHPSFLSKNRVYWFDVLKEAVSKDRDNDILYWENNDFNEVNDWLKTFEIAGFDNSKPYNGTIFRLPLRDKNNNSKISNEVFTFKNFLLWSDEWKDKTENLLFLRNIHTLTLQEIDENGNKIIHLEIKTKNTKKIQNINNSIQEEFGDDELIDICNRWKSSEIDLPLFSYHHNFSISYWNREEEKKEYRDETWAVVNGLFRGENNCLIDKAIDVLHITPNPRKVLPWAGVALCLDENKKPIKKDSQWYTFLPLPIESSHPIQLHGWFDLNPKRTEITHDGTGDYKETLISWNQQLLEYGVGVAWALLIDYIKDEKYLNSYYSFWAKKESNDLDKYLIKGFYTKIAKLDCFYIYYKNDEPKWLSPKEVDLHYFKDEKNKILLDAFKEHFPIVHPKPQSFIIENFKEVGIELIEITHEFIRNYLQEKSKDINFPVAIEKIPIIMLHKKEWLIEIIKYCADNGEDYSLLADLPLELTLNKNIYKVGSDTLFDKNPNLKLFQNMKHLYIDVDIINSIDNTDTLPSSWLEPTLKNQIGLLSKTSYWEKLNITKEWLEEVVNVIVNSTKEEFDEAKDIIKELELVYQENNEYGKLENDIDKYSPFMPRDEDIENNLIYLDDISMNVVHYEYIEIYKPLLKYEGLITELTSETLIQHLLLLYGFEFFKKKETREYLVDILTDDITWFDELTSNQISTLYSMPFIETVADNIYSKDTEIKLFLPTNFTPPKHIKSLDGEYEVIAVERNSKLYELYLKMDLTEQNINSYIQEIIIPFLKNSDRFEDKKEVLKWLSVEWKNIKDNIEEEILKELQESSIIPSLVDEKELYKASELYIPTVELGEIFNDGLYMPLSFSDEKVQEKWIDLLSDLGASKYILPQHIISKVEKIIEEENQSLAIDLLNFIANKFEIFEKMQFDNTPILDKLKEYAWFPVEKPNDILKPKSEYTKLKRADELILFDDLKIAGGYYHVLDRKINLGKKDENIEYSFRDMASKLGLITNLPNESVFGSFRELMKLNPKNGKVVNYANEFYKYLGRRLKHDTVDFDIEERTILINNQWVAPKYIYQHQINLTGIHSWNSLVGNEIESNLAKGLISLGVQEKPTFDFFIEQLQILPQEQDLNSNQLRDAKALLSAIQNEEESLFTDLVLLTKNNQLIISSKLYIDDLEAYKNSEDKNDNLLFVYYQFERLLAKRLEVTSLNENWTSEIYSYKKCESSFNIDITLKKDSFKEVILRLLYHEKKIEEHEINEEKLDNILPSQIIFTNQLIIEYSINEIFLYRSNETTYEDKNENCLYIFEQDDNEDMIEAITEYICKAMNLDKYNLLIARILRETMNKLQIDIFLEKKKIKPLPKKIDIEDEVSIFDNSHPIESDEETTYNKSTNQEENYVEKNSEAKGEIAPPTKPKASYENENTKNHNTSNDKRRVHVYADNKSNKKKNDNLETPKEKGDKGEDYIIKNQVKFLQLKDNYLEKALTKNNEGFDIYEKNINREIVRYIEVKSKDGVWGENGVSITKSQFQFAKKEADKWWLFVVENSKTDNPKVYMFKNPIITISDFMLDGSWKQLAYQKENTEPKVDDKYEIEIEKTMRICIVTNVKQRGILYQVDLILENGKEIKKKKFKKSWRKIDG